jgi:two-component system chemotaxis response regulator CheB
MSSKGRNIIVIGTSAGGLDALDELIGELPTDLPASIFIVQHMAPENTAEALLGRHRAFDCRLARVERRSNRGESISREPTITCWSRKKPCW